MYKVIFEPDHLEIDVGPDTKIIDAARAAGIKINTTCGGKGTCGKCLVKVLGGNYRLEPGQVENQYGEILACQAVILSDMRLEVALFARLAEHQVLLEDTKGLLAEKALDKIAGYSFQPLLRRYHITLPPPNLIENSNDWSRLKLELKKLIQKDEINISIRVLRKLAAVLREANWQVSVDVVTIGSRVEVVDVMSEKVPCEPFALAVDIGTTTVVVYLVNMNTGEVVAQNGTYNLQAAYGDDVITRMIYADDEQEGLGKLQQAVIKTITDLTQDFAKQILNFQIQKIKLMLAAGNTTMSHLLLGLSPKYLRLEPYIPTTVFFPMLKTHEFMFPFDKEAYLVNVPAVASYVGGDIVAGVLAVGMAQSEELSLLIDIGTNGEMVLGNREWLVSCACSAGPAFEGGGIAFGMRAMAGAIEGVNISNDFKVKLDTIEQEKPLGICGSGLIDCLSKLHRAGIIDRTGKFQMENNTPRLRQGVDGPEFVLAWAEESGIEKDIVISESDIKNLLRAKGAIFAGIRSMLQLMGLDIEAIARIYIAGGFGNYLNLDDAIGIGLLPDITREKYQFVGNTSVKGALAMLLAEDAFDAAQDIATKMTYLELSVGNIFMEEFVSATFIPHTDLSLFPSVQ